MSQPVAYNRLSDFVAYALAHPAATYNPSDHDAELDAIETTLDGICTNLALIQRDDGLLRNGSVHQDAFSTTALALIASDWTPRGLWATATLYAVGDVVEQTGVGYVAAVAHTSGTFLTDHAAGKWVTISANVSAIDIQDGSFVISGSSDSTKKARFECDTNITAGQTRVFTFQDANGTLATLENAQTFTAKPTIDASLEIGGTDGLDTLTINAATITLGNNYVATRAAGALAAGSTDMLRTNVTCTADVGGTTVATAVRMNLNASGANAFAQEIGMLFITQHGGSTTCTTQQGIWSRVQATSTGNVTLARAFEAKVDLTSSGNVTTAEGYAITAPLFTSTGQITTLYGLHSANLGNSLVTNAVGVKVDDFTGSTAMYGVQSSLSSGSGKINFYADGTADNIFRGNVRIGSTVAPSNALDVTGSVTVSGNVTTAGNTTLGDASADTLTINAGTWTLGANVVAGRAAGAVASGNVDIFAFNGSASGNATPSNVRGFAHSITCSGANLLGSNSGIISVFSHTASASCTSDSLFNSFYAKPSGADTVPDVFHYNVGSSSSVTSGTVTRMSAFKVSNIGAAAIATVVGLKVDDQSASTTMRGAQLSLSAGTNKHNLYCDGTAPNFLQGQLLLNSLSAGVTYGGLSHVIEAKGSASAETAILSARFSNDSSGGFLTLAKSRNTTPGSFTIVQVDDNLGQITFAGDDGVDYTSVGATINAVVDGTPGSNDMPCRLVFATTADGAATATERMRINSSGDVIIGAGVTNANANVTIGLTINQGGADDSIFCLKSSDVTTGASTVTLGTDVETDDYLTMSKLSATLGGLHQQVLAETAASEGFMLDVWAGAPATTDTSASLGCINIFGGQHDGSNADADMNANSNLLCVGEIDSSGARLTRMLLKADDGELNLGNTSLVALDSEDDIMAVRGLQMVRTVGGIVPTEYDRPAYSYEKLRALNIVGEKDSRGEFMVKVQPYLNLHDGAIFQLYTMYRDLQQQFETLKRSLAA